ncbi:MAG: nucleoside hydrolase [Ruminococcus sp.]
MGERIKVIMDCDPGIDDGIALAYAAAHQDELELLAVTTFAGNNTIDKVTKNALELVDFYGLNVPVARGQERPLVKEVTSCGRISRRDRAWPLCAAESRNQRLHQTMQCFLSVSF